MTSPLRDLQTNLELGNLANEEGLIGNPRVELDDALVPIAVMLANSDSLLYSWPPHLPLEVTMQAYREGKFDELTEWRLEVAPERASGLGMLDAFVRIRSGADVVSFAKRFGVLGLCDHYLPSAHNNRGVVGYGDMCDQMQFPYSSLTPLHWEPISVWLDLAAGAEALLRVVAAVYQGQETDGTVLERAISAVQSPLPPALLRLMISPAYRRGTICSIVEQWLALGGASHGLVWREHNDTPEIRLLVRDSGQPPTVAILASQLMLAVARASDLAVCTGCTSIYRRKRRPQARRRNYCQECHASGLPNRDRQRAHRAKLTELA